MKYFCLCLILASAIPSNMFAQKGGGSGGGVGKSPRPGLSTVPRSGGMTNSNTTYFVSGRVVVDDGGELPEHAAIQTVCRGQKHAETFTDTKGYFNFELGTHNSVFSSAGMGDADTTWSTPQRSRDWQECEIQASLSGFTSDTIQLSSRILQGENNDLGRLVVHRMAKVDGFTTSATTAAAPSGARKAYEKGRDQEHKANLEEAQRWLQKAVDLYPKYAIAWFELGQVQVQRTDLTGARNSFQQALAADAAYVSPYQGLAHLAYVAKDWPDVVTQTSKLLSLNPVNFPQAWFLNAVGHYCLNNFDAAEKSAREGLRLDPDHHVPKLQYLLGMVLKEKGRYPEAEQELRRYLQIETRVADVQAAQKDLEQIERLSLAASATPSAEKH